MQSQSSLFVSLIVLSAGCSAAPPASVEASRADVIHACALLTGCGFFVDLDQCASNLPVVASPRDYSSSPDRVLYAELLRAGATATSCDDLFSEVGVSAGAACETSRCDGSSAVVCGATSSLVVDCAALSSTCVLDGEGTPRCAAGPAGTETAHCDGNTAVVPSLGVLVRTDCGSDTCAVVDGRAGCLAPDEDCVASGFTCEGDVAVQCIVDGDRSARSRLDCAQLSGTCDATSERGCVISAARRALTVGCEGTLATFLVEAYYPMQFDCASVGLTCTLFGGRAACTSPSGS